MATDRLEAIAAQRGSDPDIRWLLDEVLRLREQLDTEHSVSLELARLAVRRLRVITAAVESVIQRLERSRRRRT